jgi:hypothetical protein
MANNGSSTNPNPNVTSDDKILIASTGMATTIVAGKKLKR